MEALLATLRASVVSPYNAAYAVSIALMLTRRDGRPRLWLALLRRLVVALLATWVLGTISDMVFHN